MRYAWRGGVGQGAFYRKVWMDLQNEYVSVLDLN